MPLAAASVWSHIGANKMQRTSESLLSCEVCRGDGGRAAEVMNFQYAGLGLRCLVFVANCVCCGHRWVDPVYQSENAEQVQRACAAVSRQVGTVA